jgi:hypothetical protein
MDITHDPLLEKEILDRIKRKFGLQNSRVREGIHLSDLIYCVTKAYWKRMLEEAGSPIEITDEEALLFAFGLGLEKVMLEEDEEENRPEAVEVDGIRMSPDYSVLGDMFTEFKSTRISPVKETGQPKNWPSSWIKQMKGYLYAQKHGAYAHIPTHNAYRLAAAFIIPAKLGGFRFTFTDEELETFWTDMKFRQSKLAQALEQKKLPEPYAYVESGRSDDWECKRCPMQLMCETYAGQGNFIPMRDTV